MAIKEIQVKNENIKSILNEIEILFNKQSYNIVKIYGYSIDSTKDGSISKFYIILQRHEMSLEKAIKKRPSFFTD